MNADERRLNQITEKIIGWPLDVANGWEAGSWKYEVSHQSAFIRVYLRFKLFPRIGFARQKKGNRR